MAGRIINVPEIEDGMELTEPIKNSYGQVLLNSGLVLQEKHKLMLKVWGIKKVNIKSEAIDTGNVIFSAPDQNLEIINDILNWQPRNYMESELIQLALKFNQDKRI